MNLTDAQISHLLVGTWKPKGNGAVNTITTYWSDGTGEEIIMLEREGGSEAVTVEMNWRVADGILTTESTSSSRPELVPIGLKLQDRLIEIDREHSLSQLLGGYGWGDGDRIERVRVESQGPDAS